MWLLSNCIIGYRKLFYDKIGNKILDGDHIDKPEDFAVSCDTPGAHAILMELTINNGAKPDGYRYVLFFLFVVFLLSVAPVFAEGIKGKILTVHGEAIPYATIYLPKLSTGTATNIEGNYELKLPEGKWVVLFQYLGYQTQSREVLIGKDFQEINVQLAAQDYKLPEIIVMASGEDPAFYIMRRAIALVPYYQKQVSKYSCKVYLKGSGVFEKIPFLLEKQMKKDGIKENQPFVMETLSKIDFELPDKVNQQVLSMRSSGLQNNTSPMGMITNGLYDADKYGIVSPVGKNALRTYNFSLEGVFEDQGRTINKIKVVPKVKSNDVFTGYIYIADFFWNIHSADLSLHVPMTDVTVHQLYAEVNKNTWMPVSLDFDIDFSGFGFKAKYKYVASISEYQCTLNPALDHSFIENQKTLLAQEKQVYDMIAGSAGQTTVQTKPISKPQKRISTLMEKKELTNRETIKLNKLVESEAKRNSPPEPLEIKSTFQVSQKQVNNDSAFWDKLRPIPLTATEENSFAKKDSFVRVSSTPAFQDSVRNGKRKFHPKHLLFGKSYNYSIDSINKSETLSIPNLFNPTSFSFNSVDGLRLELPFSYYRSDSTGHSLRLESHFAYTFARKKLDASLSFSKRLNGPTNSWVSASLGSTTPDYNGTSGVPVPTNEFYTLFQEQNLKRFYRHDFLLLSASRDLTNGLNLNVSIGYNDDRALQNNSTYAFIDFKDKEIVPNVPENNTLATWQLQNHKSATGQFSLKYTPHCRYRLQNNVKIYATSKYPTFRLGYKGAFSPILGSSTRFDFISFGIRQLAEFGIGDQFSYLINLGKYLNNKYLYFEDFQHFNTQSSGILFSAPENSFRLLPYYQYSTSAQFAEVYTEWKTRRLIIKQLPFFRNTSIAEKLFVNYLVTPGIKNYIETGYGLKNIFLFIDLEVVAGFENGNFRSAGVRLGLDIK